MYYCRYKSLGCRHDAFLKPDGVCIINHETLKCKFRPDAGNKRALSPIQECPTAVVSEPERTYCANEGERSKKIKYMQYSETLDEIDCTNTATASIISVLDDMQLPCFSDEARESNKLADLQQECESLRLLLQKAAAEQMKKSEAAQQEVQLTIRESKQILSELVELSRSKLECCTQLILKSLQRL